MYNALCVAFNVNTYNESCEIAMLEDFLDYCNNEDWELYESVEVDYSTYYNAYLDLVEQQISYEIYVMTQLALAKIESLSL